jgi:hypothetical protein
MQIHVQRVQLNSEPQIILPRSVCGKFLLLKNKEKRFGFWLYGGGGGGGGGG